MTNTTTTMATPPPPRRDQRVPIPGRRRFRSAGIRRAWVLGGGILTVVILVVGVLQVLSMIAHETTIVEESLTADELRGVRVVEVDSGHGAVHVVGTDGDGIRIRSEIREGLRAPTNEWRIDGDRLVITSDCPSFLSQFCGVDHDLQIPSGLKVVVATEHGDTRITGIDAPVDATTRHGSLEVVRVTGPIRIDAGFGNVRASQLTSPTLAVDVGHGDVEVSFASAPQRITVDAEFSDVDVAVPDDGTTYAVSTDAQFGETVNDLLTDPRSESVVEVRTKFGRISLGHAP
jgi:hypothetical protein